MSELTREQIQNRLRAAEAGFGWPDVMPDELAAICRYALRTLDAEADRDNYRAKFLEADQCAEEAESALRRKAKECELIKQARDRYMPCPDHRDKTTEDDQCQMCRAEQAEADANEQRRAYDDLFDEAEKIRIQRDQARQEASLHQEKLDMARGQRDQARQEAAKLRAAAQEALDAVNKGQNMRFTAACTRLRELVEHSSDAPASEPTNDWGREDSDDTHTKRATDPAPADRPDPSCLGCLGKSVTHTCEDRPEPPPNFRHIDDVIAEFERDPERKAALDEARAEIRADRQEPSEALNEREYWSGFLKGRSLSRPEPSEALDSFEYILLVLGFEGVHYKMAERYNDYPGEADELSRHVNDVRRFLSQPAPATPDAVQRLPERMRKAAVDIRINAGSYSNLSNEDAVRIACAEYWASVVDEAIAAAPTPDEGDGHG